MHTQNSALRKVTWAVIAICALSLGVFAFRVTTRVDESNAVELHLATSVERERRMEVEEALARQIRTEGFELGKAGYHLVRPGSDPAWSSGTGRWGTSAGYRWYDVPTRYTDIEYQRILPLDILPGPETTTSCVISLSRVFPNNFTAASAQQEVGGLYSVRVTFSTRAIGALRAMLAPRENQVGGGYIDWFFAAKDDGVPETRMVIVAISDNAAYRPVDIQDMITAAGSGDGIATVATGLTEVDARRLADLLNVQ